MILLPVVSVEDSGGFGGFSSIGRLQGTNEGSDEEPDVERDEFPSAAEVFSGMGVFFVRYENFKGDVVAGSFPLFARFVPVQFI